ncbi:MAG TPA: DUF389 domain-containing protein [Leptolyngbya sp.]|jgi:uncharacterized hydrophobic protein (TIGR00271 family)|nr:DUF389 domain-containing protein [Leptolyngbya sp.]
MKQEQGAVFERIRDRFYRFRQTRSDPNRQQMIQVELWEEAASNPTYLTLIIGSCIIATLGLLSNSVAVIIGAMIVAPLMLPIRALAFSALTANIHLFERSLIAITIGTGLATGISYSLGIFSGLTNFGSEILARSQPTLLDLGIAIAAGGISGYAKLQPKISGSLAGTAIAVALMPPICVVGLGIAHADWALTLGAALLYATNLLGITLACMLAFLITGCSPLKRARKPLMITLMLTGLLIVPLSLSFTKLIRQSRLESSLRSVLLNRTTTFQRLELVRLDIDWLTHPPQVRLNVQATSSISPNQVRLLENFLERETGQRFKLIFQVGRITEVTTDSKPK